MNKNVRLVGFSFIYNNTLNNGLCRYLNRHTGFVIVALHEPYMHRRWFRHRPLPLRRIPLSPATTDTLSEAKKTQTN